jgi:hypothetical protein
MQNIQYPGMMTSINAFGIYVDWSKILLLYIKTFEATMNMHVLDTGVENVV